MAHFSVGDVVKTFDANDDRLEGIVKHITCFKATGSGGKSCDRNYCTHSPKNHIWVKWPSGKLCSYNINELENDLHGEQDILDTMEDMIATGDSAEAANAGEVVKTIVQSRKNRKASPSRTVEATTMRADGSIMSMMKSDATNAAYRVASKQINTGARNAIVEMLKKKGANNAQIEGVTAFLETEWGASFISMAAGYGLSYVPMIKDNPKAQRLAKEFRVAGMANAGNEIVSAMMEQFLPVLTNALSALPEETSSSLEGHKSTKEEVEEEIEIDTSDLESHLEEEERLVNNGH
jgi:hypothetical protein